jgi:hypothetical protein
MKIQKLRCDNDDYAADDYAADDDDDDGGVNVFNMLCLCYMIHLCVLYGISAYKSMLGFIWL